MSLFKRGRQRSDETSSIINSAKTLLANIRFMDVDSPIQTMVVTSAVPNEGKTFVCANLASAIATSGKSVLLVESDLRRRSMSRTLGVHAQHGVYAVMTGEVSLADAAVPTRTPNLYFLDAEPRIPNPSDLLNSNRYLRLVEMARKRYDYVIFDTPPVGTFIDAAVLGTKVDAVFMVVREGYTRKAEVIHAAEQLKKGGCNLAGVVMNYCERSSSEYYYEYYYTHEDKDGTPDGPRLNVAASSDAGGTIVSPTPVPTGRPERATAPAATARAHHSQALAPDEAIDVVPRDHASSDAKHVAVDSLQPDPLDDTSSLAVVPELPVEHEQRSWTVRIEDTDE